MTETAYVDPGTGKITIRRFAPGSAPGEAAVVTHGTWICTSWSASSRCRYWQSGLHRGRIVPWVPSLIGVLFGLAPVLLALTGGTVLLVKRRSRRNRKRRRRLDAGATGPTAAPA